MEEYQQNPLSGPVTVFQESHLTFALKIVL